MKSRAWWDLNASCVKEVEPVSEIWYAWLRNEEEPMSDFVVLDALEEFLTGKFGYARSVGTPEALQMGKNNYTVIRFEVRGKIEPDGYKMSAADWKKANLSSTDKPEIACSSVELLEELEKTASRKIRFVKALDLGGDEFSNGPEQRKAFYQQIPSLKLIKEEGTGKGYKIEFTWQGKTYTMELWANGKPDLGSISPFPAPTDLVSQLRELQGQFSSKVEAPAGRESPFIY